MIDNSSKTNSMIVVLLCYNHAMSRVRISTTVDEALLTQARNLGLSQTDARLLDEALKALVVRYKSAQIDATYTTYDEHPLNEADEWGDLASFREAAAKT